MNKGDLRRIRLQHLFSATSRYQAMKALLISDFSPLTKNLRMEIPATSPQPYLPIIDSPQAKAASDHVFAAKAVVINTSGKVYAGDMRSHGKDIWVVMDESSPYYFAVKPTLMLLAELLVLGKQVATIPQLRVNALAWGETTQHSLPASVNMVNIVAVGFDIQGCVVLLLSYLESKDNYRYIWINQVDKLVEIGWLRL